MQTRWLTLALVLVALQSCTLAVDTSELDAGCGEGMKFCGRCVAEDDPTYGCDPAGCNPCEFPHGIPECDRERGVCIAKSCLYGWGCDDCSVSILTDELHCGGCEQPCADGQRCVEGVCTPMD